MRTVGSHIVTVRALEDLLLSVEKHVVTHIVNEGSGEMGIKT